MKNLLGRRVIMFVGSTVPAASVASGRSNSRVGFSYLLEQCALARPLPKATLKASKWRCIPQLEGITVNRN